MIQQFADLHVHMFYIYVAMVLTQHQIVLPGPVVDGSSIEPDNIVLIGQSITARHTAQDTSLCERGRNSVIMSWGGGREREGWPCTGC